jgi:membrane-bound metal-dependent hydrolase YbcI (DUF457 family)
MPREARSGDAVRAAGVAAALAVAPDLDLLAHIHRGATHSLGAAFIAGLAAVLITRNLRWGAAAAAAWTSHVLLDWLGTDTRPPAGVMAFWPFSHEFFESTVHLFPAVSRRYWLSEFWIYNVKALAVELCILVPLTWLAIAWSRRGTPREL